MAEKPLTSLKGVGEAMAARFQRALGHFNRHCGGLTESFHAAADLPVHYADVP